MLKAVRYVNVNVGASGGLLWTR